MKRKYVKPIFDVQRFCPNEFVAACNKSSICGVGNKVGFLFADSNNSGSLDAGDRLVNSASGNTWGFNRYHACGDGGVEHIIYPEDQLQKGFLVSTTAFTLAKPWLWDRKSEEEQRTYFNYGILRRGATSVWMWNHDYEPAQSGWHATLNEPLSTGKS